MNHFNGEFIAAYNWGRRAALDGMPLSSNPYVLNSAKSEYWIEGWRIVIYQENKRKQDKIKVIGEKIK